MSPARPPEGAQLPPGGTARSEKGASVTRHAPTLVAAACLLLTGCGSLVPATDKIAPPLRTEFRPTAAAVETPPNVAHEWDDFFSDARLRQVVGIALQQNRSLRASAAALEPLRPAPSLKAVP